MVLATFTQYVMNLFGGGGALEVPHKVAPPSEKIAEPVKAVDGRAPASTKVATSSDEDVGEGPPESTDDSGTESAAAACPESSSSPAKRKRADGSEQGSGSKHLEKESDEDSVDEVDSVLSTVPADSAAKAPAGDAKGAAAVAPANPASVDVAPPAVSAKDASQAAAPGDVTRSTKKPRRAAPSASS